MKLCFSTLGCPDWKLNEAYAAAKDLGVKGIEIRRLENIGFAPEMRAFSPEKIDGTVSMLKEGGVEIPLLASHAVFGKRELAKDAENEISAYCELAQKLDTPYIKISLNKEPNDFDIDSEFALGTVRRLCETAKGCDRKLLIMTNAAFSNTAKLKEFIDKAGCDNLFALWDVNYTQRFGNESPKTSMANLGSLIKFVHLKDSAGVNSDGKIDFCPLGNGDVRLKETLILLRDSGYCGYISFEWKRSWGEEFSVPGIALSHCVSFVKRITE